MSNPLGLGVMINLLSGSGSDNKAMLDAASGKTINIVRLNDVMPDGALEIFFSDGTGIRIRDNGRSCCESRYITCDDDLEYYGISEAEFICVEERETEQLVACGDEISEAIFLVVKTTEGEFTVCTHNDHNDHNGCYGGFSLVVEAI